ncbi:MAG: bifunctional salicylyl-CoA 5-hydroxylase/oxidoreductase [Alphaproteobacteria bacterium]|nr:bifunctional salicylyl-CoA 5-hydroxylase/oxidoreductase [Alphaproteobacteria bacterium]
MKIEVIGGGPAGLYFSILMKKYDPSHEITIHELNRHDDTFGFGVVFSATTLGHYSDYDALSHDAIRANFAYWDDIDVRFKGQVINCTGHDFCGMSRKTLLFLLHDRCRELGVELKFQSDIKSLDQVAGADLILACNGSNSWIRDAHKSSFKPSYDWRPNKFVWLGTTKPLKAFTFDFRRTGTGVWNIHAYQYDKNMATMIVETTEDSWRRAGLADATEADTIRFVKEQYADLLEGHDVVANKSVWRNFPTIRCGSWVHDNMVIMGDAAHTAHFSIGSGTKLAMEDAIALFEEFKTHGTVRAALAAYDKNRRDEVRRIQHAAETSLAWFEHVDRYYDMEPIQFAFSLMSRSKAITYDNLRIRDPKFVADTDQWFTDKVGREFGAWAKRETPVPPMFAPFQLRELKIENRVVMSPMCQYSARDGLLTEWHYVHLASRAVGGAGLIVTEMTCPGPDHRITHGCAGLWNDAHEAAWRRVVDFVHAESNAKICLQIGHAGRKGATKLAWEGIDQPLEQGAWPILSASALPFLPTSQVPRAMTRADMDRVRDEFVATVKRASRIGFDMIELHGAHGYLLASFLSPVTNKRTDGYGGSLENRLRYPIEVFDACRVAWPTERPMSVRISAHDWLPGGNTPDDATVIAKAFKEDGCDLISVSSGQTDHAEKPVYGRMFQVPFAEQIRIEAGIPTIVAGNIFTWDQVNTIVAAGRADFVALARAHLYNPYFTQQAAAYYGCGDAIEWPEQYVSAKFAEMRQYDREREEMRELREAALPDINKGGRSLPKSAAAEWEMRGAAIGAAAATEARMHWDE